MIRFIALFAAALLWAGGGAEAHVLESTGAGLSAGFAHPFTGLDHLAAMIGVGLWAARLGGRARWLVPGTFLGTMALGAVAGFVGGPIEAVEIAVLLSGVVFGGLVLLARSWPTSWAAAITGLFAFAHGYVHATELPLAASPVAYAAAFLAATALLLGFGLVVYVAARAAIYSPIRM
jgi:urease accessory protein